MFRHLPELRGSSKGRSTPWCSTAPRAPSGDQGRHPKEPTFTEQTPRGHGSCGSTTRWSRRCRGGSGGRKYQFSSNPACSRAGPRSLRFPLWGPLLLRLRAPPKPAARIASLAAALCGGASGRHHAAAHAQRAVRVAQPQADKRVLIRLLPSLGTGSCLRRWGPSTEPQLRRDQRPPVCNCTILRAPTRSAKRAEVRECAGSRRAAA